jgi:hypothetical protein
MERTIWGNDEIDLPAGGTVYSKRPVAVVGEQS